MPIVSSSYTLDNHTQHDGRIYVYERHVDNAGVVWPWDYLAAVGTNYDAVLAEHAAIIDAQLAPQEYQQIIGGADV